MFPSQFVNARLLIETRRGATVVPTAAIQSSPKGPFVYVVRPDRTVGIRQVTVGVTDGDDDVDRAGLAVGEQVVVEGAERLRDGAAIDAAERSVNLSRPFILRPVATTLLMAALLLAGALAYRLLPVSALPQVDYPTIQVFTFYPGASPDVMASSVTAPLERFLGQMPGLNQMTSTSSSGSSVITLQFTLSLGPRRGRAGGAGGDQLRADAPAAGSAEPARIQQR